MRPLSNSFLSGIQYWMDLRFPSAILNLFQQTLNSQFEGIDLMIPLILQDGKVTFLGIQVKFVLRTSVATTINKAIDKMIFKKMFGKKNIEGRPFGLLILAFGDYDYLKAYVDRRSKNSTAAPSILTIEGDILPKTDSRFFNLVPESFTDAYRGINPILFTACDRLDELVTEVPLSEWEKDSQVKAERYYRLKRSKNGQEKQKAKHSKSGQEGHKAKRFRSDKENKM